MNIENTQFLRYNKVNFSLYIRAKIHHQHARMTNTYKILGEKEVVLVKMELIEKWN